MHLVHYTQILTIPYHVTRGKHYLHLALLYRNYGALPLIVAQV
jgi:hypothetical protein